MPRAARRDIFAFGKSDIATAAQLYYIRSVNAAKITEKALATASAFFWQGHKDSNSGHAVLETAALPTELYPYVFDCCNIQIISLLLSKIKCLLCIIIWCAECAKLYIAPFACNE